MARTVEVATELECTPDAAWHWLQRPALLDHVAEPMMRFEYEGTLDRNAPWPEGEHAAQLVAFGRIPFGRQVIGIEYVESDGDTRIMRDNGRSALIRKWDHWVTIAPAAGGAKAHYIDRVHIDAGALTAAIAAYAKAYYTHRQRRWRALAKQDFAALRA
jgi:hypothetical protein